MRAITLALILLWLGSSSALADRTNLVIFADFGCSDAAIADPDDCLAVEALRRSETVNILAVVAAGGNVSERLSYQLGQELFPNLLVLPGSRPRARYWSNTHRQIRKLIIESPSAVTVVVFSPATDFAELVTHHQAVLSNVDQVVFVAGRSPGDAFRAQPGGRLIRDMNYEKDRRSFRHLLPVLNEHRVAVTFVGFRAAMTTPVPAEFMPSAFVNKAQRRWRRKTRVWFGASLPAFDVVAAMAVTPWRSALRCRPVTVRAGRDMVLLDTERSRFQFCE